MKALYAGTFDPFTIGHLSIVERASKFCDEIYIAIGYNENKKCQWSIEERVSAISELFEKNPKIKVTSYEGLTLDYAKSIGIDVLIRGIRDVKDFEVEKNLADINFEIGGLDTIILVSLPKYSFVSSSMVKELLHNGYDARNYIAGNFKQ